MRLFLDLLFPSGSSMSFFKQVKATLTRDTSSDKKMCYARPHWDQSGGNRTMGGNDGNKGSCEPTRWCQHQEMNVQFTGRGTPESWLIGE